MSTGFAEIKSQTEHQGIFTQLEEKGFLVRENFKFGEFASIKLLLKPKNNFRNIVHSEDLVNILRKHLFNV